jgi:hypothetical protein
VSALRQALARVFPDAAARYRPPCRKVAHKSWGAAEAHIRASLRREDTCVDGDRLEPYDCPSCGMVHVGHKRERAGG